MPLEVLAQPRLVDAARGDLLPAHGSRSGALGRSALGRCPIPNRRTARLGLSCGRFVAAAGRRFSTWAGNAAGVPQGGSIAVVPDSGTTGPRAYNARIAYKRVPGDDFVVVWELARNNQPGLIQARVVEPLSGALGPIIELAQTDARPWARLGERFPGGVDIAYDETQDHFYVAWRDETDVMLHRAPASLSGGFDSIVFSETPGTWGIQGGSPEVVVAEGYGKIYVSHPVSLANVYGSGNDGYFVNGAWFTATGSFGWSPLSTAWSEEAYDNVVGGFSPVMDMCSGSTSVTGL